MMAVMIMMMIGRWFIRCSNYLALLVFSTSLWTRLYLRCRVRALACLDIFPNIDRIKKVQCPVMIIHGARDEEVNISHGQSLHEAVPEDLRREPWWVPDRGHNDITDGRTKMVEYIERLRLFLNSLD